MRPPAVVSGLLALVLAGGVLSAALPDAAADPTPPSTPSQAEVDAARAAAGAAGGAVQQVQEQLDAAASRADAAAEKAARAAEAFNGAQVEVTRTRTAQQQAEVAAAAAAQALAQQSADYRAAVISTSALGADTSGVGAYLEADGMDDLLERSSSDGVVRDLFAARQRAWTTAKATADRTSAAASAATTAAEKALARVGAARERAADEARRAGEVAAEVAGRRAALVAELARLQGISVELAQQRQDGLAAERAAAARAAAESAARAAAEKAAQKAAEEAARRQGEKKAPKPPAKQDEERTAGPSTTSVPRTGAAAAVAFARAQIGEPYEWAAAGPDAWDCSGLVAAAWAAGGVDLPHWSVAQYDASTPVALGQLAPGDLVFWSDGGPGGIYHVALYVGDGRIVHAPRTGRPVSEESMFYWRSPDFYARP